VRENNYEKNPSSDAPVFINFTEWAETSPMSYWMKYGLTQVEKGKKDGTTL
jgi:uncharacterized protein YdeI (YjbR/CyaY-like superfamily)